MTYWFAISKITCVFNVSFVDDPVEILCNK